MSMENLIKATDALNSAGDAYHNKIDQITDTLDAKSAEVDQRLATLFDVLNTPLKMSFDPSIIHSKSSLNLAVDPSDNSRTQWAALNAFSLPAQSILNLTAAINQFAATVNFSRCNGSVPGNFNNPRYSEDYSFTISEFVIGNQFSSSDSINQYLEDENIEPATPVRISFPIPTEAKAIVAPIVGNSFARLFVRFRNVIAHNAITQDVVAADAAPQPIDTHGGTGAFALQELAVFQL